MRKSSRFLNFYLTAIPTSEQSGPGLSLQASIDDASPGDTIVMPFAFRFTEAILIDKPLRLVGAKSGGSGLDNVSSIDAGCLAPTALTVTADKVSIRNVHIAGATQTTVDVTGTNKIAIRNSRLIGDCPGIATGLVLDGTTKARVRRNLFTTSF
ncbi:MAG: hypothetical protein ACI8TX_003988 [Hyphomicrobiaceae bacterium]|jgi:hypothetical protein